MSFFNEVNRHSDSAMRLFEALGISSNVTEAKFLLRNAVIGEMVSPDQMELLLKNTRLQRLEFLQEFRFDPPSCYRGQKRKEY